MCALDLFKKLGDANDAEIARKFLEQFVRDARGMDLVLIAHGESDDDGELLEIMLLVMCINSSCWDHRI